jgi:quercetin dioxygenase-like cupin family protein
VPTESKPPTTRGPAESFTGDVYIDPVVRATEPSRVNISAVRSTPGARTAWHSHTVNQTLLVTEGLGLHQPRGAARKAERLPALWDGRLTGGTF